MQKRNSNFTRFDQIHDTYDEIIFVRTPAERLVAHAAPPEGASVLDVACGTGWATIEAARAVGPTGNVRGIDIGSRLIDIAQQKTRDANLTNVDYAVMDGHELDFADESFDIVICGAALFEFPDIPKALAEWQRVLRPGGCVVFSVWGKGFRKPLMGMLFKRIFEVRPDLVKPNRFDAMDTDEKCRKYLEEAGYTGIEIISEDLSYAHQDPESYWRATTSDLMRMWLDGLTPDELEQVRSRHLEDISDLITSDGIPVNVPTLFGIGHKA